MDDFNDLASSLAAGIADVRGCLILSRDGLVLGAHPSDAERQITPSWVRFAAMGDPERGFAQFGSETWCYVRRGPYATFAVVGVGARPGLVIDHMEQVLLAAEEGRARRDAVRTPEPPAAPSSKPRAPLHPETRPDDAPVVIVARAKVVQADGAVPERGPRPPQADAPGPDTSPPPTSATAPPEAARSGGPPPARTGSQDEHEDVDRFSLAREFGRLLQRDEEGADG